MSARRFHDPDHHEAFAFAPATEREIASWESKYPAGRRQSAVIPALWLAQKQNGGWLSEPAMRAVADRLGMSYIRVFEVATFYTMFNLSPVGRQHVQLCGTTPCMLRGAEQLKATCERRIGPKGQVSADGQFSWVEVECLGACVNAPMVQINDYYYEDLTPETLERVLDEFAAGREPPPGVHVARQTSAPMGSPTSLMDESLFDGSAARPLSVIPGAPAPAAPVAGAEPAPRAHGRPAGLAGPRGGAKDDLKRIDGVDAKVEQQLNELGVFHFDQIAGWDAATIEWVDGHIAFTGRIARERWIEQAAVLARGGGGGS